MTIRRVAASVVMGLFVWVVLLFIHEEWRLPSYQVAFGPPPFNPFNWWTPVVLIVVIWWLLNVFLRWADRQLEEPRTAKH